MNSFINTSSEENPTPELTQKAYLNAVASFLDFGAKVLVSFVVTPILVSGLGSVLFGVWQILSRIVSYMSVADGRPTQALKWVMANHQATDDEDIKRRAIGSALGVWLLILPVMITLGIGLIWFIPLFTGTPTDLIPAVRLATTLLVINLILSGFVLIPEAVLRGMNLGYKRMGLVAGLNVLGGILTVTAVYLEWGLIGVAAAQVVTTIITGILFWYLVKLFIPWFGVARASFGEIRTFLSLSVWYAGWNFVNKLLIASDVVILGLVLTASSVTTYVLTGYIAQTLLAVVTLIIGAILPGLGKLFQQKEYPKVVKLRDEMLIMSSLFAGVTGSMILLWNRSFITLWVGPEHYAGHVINLLLVLIAVQFLFIRNDTYLIDLTLDIKRKVVIGTISALLSIGLSLLLIQTLGIVGLCLGILLGRIILTLTYPFMINSFLGVSSRAQLSALLRPILTMSILFASTTQLSLNILAPSWLALIIYAGLTLLLLSFIQFRLGFSSRQRKRLLQRASLLRPLAFKA